MINLSKLIDCMPQKPIKELIFDGGSNVSHGIYLLETSTILEPNSIYVGEPSVILPFLANRYGFTVTFVSSGTCAEYGDEAYENINLYVTEISVTTLYNYMNRTLMRFLTLHRDFSEASHRGDSIETIVRIISGYLPYASLYILDSGLKVMAQKSVITQVGTLYSALAKKIDDALNVAGYLEVEDFREIEKSVAAKGNYTVFLKRLVSAKMATHYLLIFFPTNQEVKPVTIPLILQVCAEMIEYFKENSPLLLVSPEIGEFVQALMERKIKTNNEAKARLISLGAPSYKYVTSLVIEFEGLGPSICIEYLAEKMKGFFPQAVFASYQRDLIVFVPATRGGEFPEFDQASMEVLLENCEAYLGVSFPVRSLISLPTMHWDAKNAIACGTRYNKTRSSRIFWAKNFVFDKVLDLCACSGNNKKINGNLGYLCSPIIIALIRYDHRHKTDYTKVLEEYVNSGENMAECARRMYIHRNTLVNKLAKIEEITGCTLGDVYLMHTIFFGFQVYHYITEVQEKNLITELDK